MYSALFSKRSATLNKGVVQILFEKAINRLLRITSFILFIMMIVIVFAQVILRYFLGSPLAWSDELARLLLVWVSFLGVTIVHYSDIGHPAVTFLVDKMPNASRELLDILLNLMLVICLAAIFWAGLQYTIKNHRFVSAVLHYPNSVKYAIIPFCMMLMAIKSIERISADLRKMLKGI